jgi:hypothetical protein
MRWILARAFSNEIRRSAREKLFENFGAQIELRWLLVVTNPERLGVVRVVQLGLNLLDFVFLHEEKSSVEGLRQVPVLVVADVCEVTQNPWERIDAGSNYVSRFANRSSGLVSLKMSL